MSRCADARSKMSPFCAETLIMLVIKMGAMKRGSGLKGKGQRAKGKSELGKVEAKVSGTRTDVKAASRALDQSHLHLCLCLRPDV